MVIQREFPFRFKWERDIFQDSQTISWVEEVRQEM
jgi:hypothetical protein